MSGASDAVCAGDVASAVGMAGTGPFDGGRRDVANGPALDECHEEVGK